MYKRIVVPLDGSELAERAVPHAIFLSRQLDLPIHLIRVIDNDRIAQHAPFGLGLAHAAYEQARSTEEAESREYLATVERSLIERKVTVTDEIRCGIVFQEIVAAVQQDDLLVIASHGRGGVTRWFIGSVAEDIVRHSPAPVLLIPHTALHNDARVNSLATACAL